MGVFFIMNKTAKIIIVVGLAALVAIVIALKQRESPSAFSEEPKAGIPRLLDIGSTKCIPCKMMAPILEELKSEYAGELEVEVIDLKIYPDAGNDYKIKVIPTQIFFDASGREFFRHEGFFPKESILDKFKEFGILLETKEKPADSQGNR